MAPRKKPKDFFARQEPHSATKAAIVSDYFGAWARILAKSNGRVLFLDTFCGPGKYDDGSESTPIVVLKKLLEDVELSAKVMTFFGDEDAGCIDRLNRAISELGVESLKYKPFVFHGEFDKARQEEIAGMKLVPTLMFIDPFGYKMLSADLIRAIIKNHGSECIFFFNYNRIMPAINNDSVRHIVDAIFGKERVDYLKGAFDSLDDKGKESAIIEALRDSMTDIGGKYTLPFRFTAFGRITHHLVFVSTHPLGHDIMKGIMSGKSSDRYQDVGSFEFREGAKATNMFAKEPTPIDDLKEALLRTYAGKSLTVQQIHDQHNLGTQYVMKNYQEALKQLMREGKIPEGARTEQHKPSLKSPYKTMPKDVLISFPVF